MNNKKIGLFFILSLFIILGLSTINATEVANDTVSTNDISISSHIAIDNPINDNVNTKYNTKINLGEDEYIPTNPREVTLTVTDYESLKTAWNDVVTSGNNETNYVINLKNGEYKFDEALNVDSTSDIVSLTLNGEDKTKTILNGQQTTQILNFNNPALSINIKNLTFSNANGTDTVGGGAIYSNSNFMIDNCIFKNNSVCNNVSYSCGGALYIVNNARIINSEFINNFGVKNSSMISQGATIYHTAGFIKAENCTFKNNYFVDNGDGGVFYGTNTGYLNVTKSTFINNSALGGGVFYEGNTGKVNITYCDFINNTARTGAVLYHGWLYADSDYHMNYCIFDGNTPSNNIISGQTQQGHADYTGNYYADGSQPNGFKIIVNKKLPVVIFDQNTKNITISLKKDDVYGFTTVNGLGCNGTTFQVSSNSDLINTDGITLTNDNNYTATVDLSDLPENYENITISVDEDEVAVITWDYTNIVLNDITTNVGKTINLTAKVSTSKNVGINTGLVVFKINGKTIGSANVSFGKAILSYTIPDDYSAKNYTITADYKKNNKFQGAITNSTLSIEKLDTRGTLFIEDIAGKNSTITYNVIDSEGNKVTKGTVIFKVNGVTIGSSNITNGISEYNYFIPTKYAGKKINVTAVLGTNNKYIENRVKLQKTLPKLNTTSTIIVNNLNPKKLATITVHVLDQNNNNVTNGKVAIKVNGITIATSNVINGIASATYNIPEKWANKEVRFDSTYSGTLNYISSKEHKTETVSKLNQNKLIQNKLTDSRDATLYVSSNSGADTNDGTQSNPLKTIEKAINIVNTTKTPTTIYLDGIFKGLGNTNLTVPGDLTISFIGLNDAKIDGEVNYTIKTQLDPGEYYWGSSPIWYPYNNGTGNWAMTITEGTGKISITNLTIQNCWAPGGTNINAYEHSTIDNYGNLDVINVTFYFNHGGVGGSIRNNNGATIYVENSMFDSNRKSSTTGNYGPGIYNNGTATIINSIFQNNYARWGTITNDKNITIINCTIQNNIGYDGGSTYKTGSGITINTEGTTFGSTGTNTGINTIIDGCIFYNNDQLDLYADYGSLTLNNSVFNQSSGMVVPNNNNANRQTNYIITNNIFTSLTGSSLYTSLATNSKAMFAMRLQGAYTYTIDNNIVTNITGNDHAIELTQGYATITNNNFTRQLWLSGNYNVVNNNNITTTSDIYAINMSGSYSNITFNYLEATAYTGNDAVNFTDNTNTVEDNIPIQTSIKINDDTFERYFTKDGELFENLNEITQIEVIGILTDKNMILNRGNELNIIQAANFNSSNITITVTNNTKVNINGLKIINNNNKAVLNITTNENTITQNTFITNNEYTIILTGTNNTVNNNYLIAYILVGDESVNAPEDNTITSNTPTYKNVLITNNNYNTYFDTEGKLITTELPENARLLFSGNFYNKTFIFTNGTNIIVNHDDVTLYNSTIIAQNDAILNVSYIKIENTNGQIAINSSAKEIYLFYNNITTTSDAVIIKDATIIDMEYNNINATSTENITALTIDNGTATTASYNNYRVLRNNLTVIGPEVDADYISGLSGTTAVLITNMPAIQFSYNNINVTSNGASGYYPTIYAVNVINGTLENFVRNCRTRLYQNVIYTSGQNYLYGINTMNITSEIMYNEIHANSQLYSAGIQATNTKSYYTTGNTYGISYNKIYSTCLNAYGIVLTMPYDLMVVGNEIYTTGNNSIGIDVYGSVKNNSIQRNEITADGNYTSGITLTSCEEINMTQNTIITKNDISEDSRIVNIVHSNKVSLTSNIIKGYVKNTVVIDENSTYISVSRNTLYATGLFGDESVLDLNGDNRVMDNTPNMDNPQTYYFLDETTYDTFFDENGVLRDTIEDGMLIQQTGDLYNKTLNITKPITLISTATTLFDCTIILTGNYVKLINQSFVNTNIESLIVNSNNNIVQYVSFDNYVTEAINITFVTIKGKNNKISFGKTSSFVDCFNVECRDQGVNSNIVLQQLSGKNNTLDDTGVVIARYCGNVISILIKDLINGNCTGGYISPRYCYNAQNVVIINTSNSKISLSQPDNYDSINWTCLVIENSTNNYIQARITNQGQETTNTILMIMNNSDNNYLNLTGGSNYGVNSIPYIISNSNNNTIASGSFNVPNYDGYVINLTKSYNNTIYFNTIQSKTYKGDNAILQDNQENIVRDNIPGKESTYSSNNVFLNVIPSTTTVTVGDTITITAYVTYKEGTAWNAPLYPVTSGTVLFDVNGELSRVAVDEDGIASVNYTVPFTSQESFKVVTEYEYNTEYAAKLTENTITVIKRNATLTILDDNHEYKAGETVTIRAILTDGDTLIKSGRVVFKLNGITLKDENGKPIYAKVVNGIAILNYTISNTFSAKTYNITAAFSTDGYNRAENTSQLTIAKTNTHIETDIIKTSTNTANIVAKILDENNNLIKSTEKVTIKVNGVTVQKAVSITNGLINLTIDTPYKNDVYTVTIIVSESSRINTSRVNTILVVNK